MTTTTMLTADEAIAQGSTPATFFSIAKFNERMGNARVGQQARLLGREIARITGADIGGRRRPGNDNRAGMDNARRRRRSA